MSIAAVVVEDLRVAYGATSALDGIDLDTPQGTVLRVLGHNGAGKTTLIRVLTTLIQPSSGWAAVDGFDVVTDADQVRRRIGVTGQYSGLDEFLTGRENLELIGRLTGLGGRARLRADALIDRLQLGEIADRRIGQLSGGSRRRIDLAASLGGTPSVLFLDEPTTGLDPIARTGLWDVVAELTATGTTVVLTTQYLDEADRLADHIVVLDHGRVVARGAPGELKRSSAARSSPPPSRSSSSTGRPTGRSSNPRAGPGDVAVTFSADDAGSAADLVARSPTPASMPPTSRSPPPASTTCSHTSRCAEPEHDRLPAHVQVRPLEAAILTHDGDCQHGRSSRPS